MSGPCPLGRSRLFSPRSWLARPPAFSLPARAPRARPLRPAPLPSELEPVAAAPGFPQCTARRSSHPMPSPRVRPPLPRHPGAPALTPAPRLRAPGPPRSAAWTSVCLSTGRPEALPAGTPPRGWTPDAGSGRARVRPEPSAPKGSGPGRRCFSGARLSPSLSSDTY